ncbi:PREDICTED: glutamate receptor 2-like [Nicrophorus vespilloides]|uniref:Glutamate receptor 2-like n=1 Tax=Nicrophorus vespilloides TaxID=110193 RepID=A0ABM1MLZ6_NICVS|nr:PREDICTED: glutamate receptor 2-like [Nicrophorus vespilloides]
MSKIFAFLLLVATTNCYLDPQLIKDYFQEKSVKTAQIYSCAPKIGKNCLKNLKEPLKITALQYIGLWQKNLASAFVFRHPKRKAAFEVFLRPLQKFVWVTIVFAIVVVALILKFVVKFEAQIRGNTRNREIESTWSSMLLMILGALCQQGCSNIPAFISGRIVTIFVFVFSVLLYQFYSGSIVSFLLMQPAKTMNTIRDLAFSDLRMGCEDILYTRQYFKQLFQNKEIARMTKRTYKANAPFYLHPELGLELVSRGGFAYHVDLATAYSIIEKTFQESAICELEEIPFFEARPVMSSFPKGSPFRDAFNYCFQKMAERGIFNRQTKHYHARKPDCIRSNAPTSPVGIDEFYPAMVILSIGVSLSLTVLILEQIVHIHTRKQNKKKLFQFTN